MTASKILAVFVLMVALLTACQSTGPVPTGPGPSPTDPNPPIDPEPTDSYELLIVLVANGKVTGEGIDCGIASVYCTRNYAEGSSVTLTATPAEGYVFDSWDGACSTESSSICTLTMDDDKITNAVFAALASANSPEQR